MATLTTKEAVLRTAPFLVAVSDGEWEQVLEDVGVEMPGDNLGESAELAQRLLVAHCLSLVHPELGTQLVQSVTIGGMSKTYATSQSMPTDPSTWGDTPYGQRLQRLVDGLLLGVLVT